MCENWDMEIRLNILPSKSRIHWFIHLGEKKKKREIQGLEKATVLSNLVFGLAKNAETQEIQVNFFQK